MNTDCLLIGDLPKMMRPGSSDLNAASLYDYLCMQSDIMEAEAFLSGQGYKINHMVYYNENQLISYIGKGVNVLAFVSPHIYNLMVYRTIVMTAKKFNPSIHIVIGGKSFARMIRRLADEPLTRLLRQISCDCLICSGKPLRELHLYLQNYRYNKLRTIPNLVYLKNDALIRTHMDSSPWHPGIYPIPWFRFQQEIQEVCLLSLHSCHGRTQEIADKFRSAAEHAAVSTWMLTGAFVDDTRDAFHDCLLEAAVRSLADKSWCGYFTCNEIDHLYSTHLKNSRCIAAVIPILLPNGQDQLGEYPPIFKRQAEGIMHLNHAGILTYVRLFCNVIDERVSACLKVLNPAVFGVILTENTYPALAYNGELPHVEGFTMDDFLRAAQAVGKTSASHIVNGTFVGGGLNRF